MLDSLPPNFIKLIHRLLDDVFACLLNADYVDNLYLYEHRVHKAKKKCATYILKQNDEALVRRLIITYNAIIDCSLLRWRIKDKTELAICRDELMAVLAAIKNGAITLEIAALEAVYQNVLMVTAKEPLPFYLFIQSLKSLEGKL